MIEFQEWPKIARLNREIVVTEKIDGTNAAVIVQPVGGLQNPGVGSLVTYARDLGGDYWSPVGENLPGIIVDTSEGYMVVAAQSRKRVISPGKSTDNFGFAGWVREHAQELADGLGVGYHYGEWCGRGIQRGYGLEDKRFVLFNVHRWTDERPDCCDVVPTLYSGPFSQYAIEWAVENLRDLGSCYAPGFKPAEGVIVYHTAARTYFKVTCEKDEEYKGKQR